MVDAVKPLVRVLMGAPGAGKSTYCASHIAELGAVFSLDQARAEVGRHEHDQAATSAAIDLICDHAGEYLLSGGAVTIDTTAARLADRRRWVALAKAHDARSIVTRFSVPLEVALARNAARARPVPHSALKALWWAVESTTDEQLLAEGFDAVEHAHVASAGNPGPQ